MDPFVVYDITPEKPNVVPHTREFYPELFHCLPTDTFGNIIERLKKVFIHSAQPTAQWSVNVAAPPHVPNSVPPNQPLGVLIKVQGSVGQGQVLQLGLVHCECTVCFRAQCVNSFLHTVHKCSTHMYFTTALGKYYIFMVVCSMNTHVLFFILQ